MTILQHILHFFFPITCTCCHTDLPADDYYRICATCLENIKMIEGFYCLKCGIPLPDGGAHCFHCREKTSYHFENIRSVAVYEGLARDLIGKFKYQSKDYLNRFLGRLLIYAIDKYSYNDVDIVIPVPIHWLKKMRRGYNQSELLAIVTAKYISKPLISNILIKTRLTRPQMRLNRENRIANLGGSFSVREKELIKGKNILLIDDVCTTGATIEECAKVLTRSGANKVYGLTVARD